MQELANFNLSPPELKSHRHLGELVAQLRMRIEADSPAAARLVKPGALKGGAVRRKARRKLPALRRRPFDHPLNIAAALGRKAVILRHLDR